MLNKVILHPFLFSLVPILFLFQHNIHELPLENIIEPLFFSLVIVFFIWLGLRFIIGNSKAGLLSSFIVLLFFIYANLHTLIISLDNEVIQIFARNSVLGSIFLFCFIIGVIYLIKTKSTINKTFAANTMSIVIVAFLLINVATYYASSTVELTAYDADNIPVLIPNIEKKPNVYFILLDAHAGKQALDMDFNYDLTEFNNNLEKRGFVIPDKSYSNYPNTALSAPSIMNMIYLDFLTEDVGINSKDKSVPQYMLKHNTVMKIFNKNGYRVTSFYGGAGAAGDISLVDEKLCKYRTNNADFRTSFVKTYLTTTIFNQILIDEFQRDKLECFFSTILNFEEDEQRPEYVHGHIRLPHYPYVYNQNGEHVYDIDSANKNAYLEQLIFADKKTLELVDSIQNRSAESVIIIMSDHGFRQYINWEEPEKEDFIRGFNTISAFYFPGKTNSIPSEVSAVNTFRIFFNTYFDTNYEILEDRHIWYTEDKPYDFEDISHEFKK